MKRTVLLILIALFFCVAVSMAYAADAASTVKRANKLYRQKKYNEALSLYNQALTQVPESSIINYDLGSCEYKEGDFEKAANSFKKSLMAQDKKQEAWANFNLGNSKYKLGELKQQADLDQAVKSLQESVHYYKRAVELGPKDNDAKINYELADQLLRELQEKLKQQKNQEQEQKQQQEQPEKQQENKQQEGEQKQPQKQSKEQQEDKQQEEKEKQPQEEENKQKQSSEEHQQEEKQRLEEQLQQGAREQDIKEMSQQEARMLLEGLRQEENEIGRLKDTRRGVAGDVLKDW
ncbi:MAG: tetratricopeptide repeat protein [Candidatus Omnitrophota bacterium]